MLIFEFMEYLQVRAPCRVADTFRPSILLKCVSVTPLSTKEPFRVTYMKILVVKFHQFGVFSAKKLLSLSN